MAQKAFPYFIGETAIKIINSIIHLKPAGYALTCNDIKQFYNL